MNEAKIRLSAKEMELVTNADWILTKNDILLKTKQLLEQLLLQQQLLMQDYTSRLPVEVAATTPKISKGENYKGLPYLVLDYPRFFDRHNIFAIRTMFWWGNFFSSTLHLSGIYKKNYQQRIIDAFPGSVAPFIAAGESEWEHHFDKENYTLTDQMDKRAFAQCITEKDFLKLAHRIPLQQWDDALPVLASYFNSWLKLLAD